MTIEIGWSLILSTLVVLSSSPEMEIRGRVDCPGPAVVAALPKHPTPRRPPTNRVATIDQRDMTFIPSILAVQVGTRVQFPNHDPLFHNVFSISKPQPFNLGMYGPNETRSIVLQHPGIIEVRCMVHPEMVAHIVVVPTPYFTVADKQTGRFTLRGIPPGQYRLYVWSPTCGEWKTDWMTLASSRLSLVLRPSRSPNGLQSSAVRESSQ